jgi:hypothetical protein
MSIEILDRGSCKAAGLLILNPAPGDNVFVGLGISALASIDANTVRLTLVEPIGSTEFLALAGPRSAQAGELCSIVWESNTTFRVENIDETAIVLLDLMIFRITGRGTFTAAAIAPPPPPP